MKALSIVFPSGTKIANGEKTIEVRSWKPPEDFEGDLLIVENNIFLKNENDIDPNGRPVALVKIRRVREYLESDIVAACASRWEPGYFSWELYAVRPIDSNRKVLAARGIYDVISLNLTKEEIKQ
jgi:hypothetical protein